LEISEEAKEKDREEAREGEDGNVKSWIKIGK